MDHLPFHLHGEGGEDDDHHHDAQEFLEAYDFPYVVEDKEMIADVAAFPLAVAQDIAENIAVGDAVDVEPLGTQEIKVTYHQPWDGDFDTVDNDYDLEVVGNDHPYVVDLNDVEAFGGRKSMNLPV